jgi:molybdopterin/thiamine biosynthesis adenylyltransferase/rhodanese-related sulfurtransferase
MLSKEEQEQYSRQIRLGKFGEECQGKLKSAKVLVVGAGALGCPVLQYLTTAGVGKIGIVDGDLIERSNLHRQVLYTENDLNSKKAETAADRLRLMNPKVQIETFPTFLSNENAFEISSDYDIIIDGTDNFPTRYLVNDLCVLIGKINIHGSIQQYSGQVSVFNSLQENGKRSPNYRDLFPVPPKPEDVISCAEGGVIGALPGIIGSIMAMESIKAITGIGDLLAGKLLQYNSLNHHTQILNFSFDDQNPLRGNPPDQTELINYQTFCRIPKKNELSEITVAELKIMRDENQDFQLVDVREIHEFHEANLGGDLIPLSEIPERFSEISKNQKVIVHCKSGGRSAKAIKWLQETHGFENLYNLRGGIIAWLMEIQR